MKEEQAYERLMRALHEMQTQIEEGVVPWRSKLSNKKSKACEDSRSNKGPFLRIA